MKIKGHPKTRNVTRGIGKLQGINEGVKIEGSKKTGKRETGKGESKGRG